MKVTIIGSGIAGLTCAIYTARAGIETMLITGSKYGGCTSQAPFIENFPSYVDGISGSDLMENVIQQAERHGVTFIYDTVVDTNFSYLEKSVTLESGEKIVSDYVVIATGSSHKPLNIPSEEIFIGRGLHYCAVCDGSLYGKGNVVGIVGGGESAFQEALYLSKLCTAVHMYIRKNKARVCTTMLERAEKTDNIVIHYNTTVESLWGSPDGYLEFIYTRTGNASLEERRCDGLFIALGYYPNTRVFREHSNITLNRDGYILVDRNFRASTDKVYAIGDCVADVYKQAIIAAGSGASCAMDIISRG
jgi:thioredoxin reductase (NADPH)